MKKFINILTILFLLTGILFLISLSKPINAQSDTPVYQSSASCGRFSTATDTSSVTCSISGGSNQLYIAVIGEHKYTLDNSSVSGLGLSWTKQKEQCSNRGLESVEIWTAYGTSSGGNVQINFSPAVKTASVAVLRYSNVDSTSPIENPAGSSTSGQDSTICNSGSGDSDILALNMFASQANSVAIAGSNVRQRDITSPDGSYTQRADVIYGSGDPDGVHLYVHERSLVSSGSDSVDHGLNGSTDWAMGGIVIRPAVVSTPTPTVSPYPTPGGTHGLNGEYYDNSDLTNLKLTRTDPTVNFDWAEGSPDASIGVDSFSARWTGKVFAPYSGTYTFYTVSDDGVRLWVNGVLLIDNWTNHSATFDQGTIDLTAGLLYDIKLEYYEYNVNARIELYWSHPDISYEIIPSGYLYLVVSTPTPTRTPTPTATQTPTPTPINSPTPTVSSTPTPVQIGDNLDTVNNIYSYSGLGYYTLDPGFDGNRTAGKDITIFLISGSLEISQNFSIADSQDSVVFIVNGNIYIDGTVSNIAGLYISSQTFTIAESDLPIIVNGMVYAKSTNFKRKFYNLTEPTYTFIYQPEYLIDLLPYLARPQVNWQELAP